MKSLSSTWFKSNAISVEPSFRSILNGVHEFLDLFGKVKPSSMSDGLIARVLNFNSYWTNLMSKTVYSFDKYREKRFEVALQVLLPIISDNFNETTQSDDLEALDRFRIELKTSILSAKAIADYVNSERSSTSNNKIETKLQTLFDWADKYSFIVVESLLTTFANNITRLETLIHTKEDDNSKFNSTEVWNRFCSRSVNTYLSLGGSSGTSSASLGATDESVAKLAPALQTNYIELSEAQNSICKFEWLEFQRIILEETHNSSERIFNTSSNVQLIRVALTKWGQLLDTLFPYGARRSQRALPKFLTLTHWQALQEKLPQISPPDYGPSDFEWLWQGFERVVQAVDDRTNRTATADAVMRIFDQLNCALDSVKGGITWDNLANIYQDKQDILAVHSTINNGIGLAFAGANTFLAHKKYQNFLDDFIRPRAGLAAFCSMRNKTRLDGIFSVSDERSELSTALVSFQELLCDTNLEVLAQNLNPISVCYQLSPTVAATAANATQPTKAAAGHLTDTMDRFFKMLSLAMLDAKLVHTNDAKPSVFDKSQWDHLRAWWLNQTEAHQGNSGLALTLVRVFQTIDSVVSQHIVWQAIFRSVHEMSEMAAYLIRAAELESTTAETASELHPEKPTATTSETIKQQSNNGTAISLIASGQQQKYLVLTLTNIMFPETSNFISFKTFKQLRYVKSISDYFVANQEAQEVICKNSSTLISNPVNSSVESNSSASTSKLQLINYRLDSREKLFALLCHYQSSQWLTAMNIVLSPKTASLSKKVNYMTKYLSIYTKHYNDTEKLQSFIHGQQLENIEAVANTTVSYLIALSRPFRTLTLSRISNISWRSLPKLFDSIDGHLCATKYENNQTNYQLAVYEPRKPELETILCKLPSWNMTQVYDYLSENFDLKNMISLVAQNNRTATLFGLSTNSTNKTSTTELSKILHLHTTNNSLSSTSSDLKSSKQQTKICITPFKFISRWLKIAQDLIDEIQSKTSRDKMKTCFGLSKKNQSFQLQALRYAKLLNSVLSSINNLTVNNSWHVVRKTWNSISYALLNRNSSPATTGPKFY